MFFFFKQKTAYEMRISDWSSDVCSSDLQYGGAEGTGLREFNGSGYLGTDFAENRGNISLLFNYTNRTALTSQDQDFTATGDHRFFDDFAGTVFEGSNSLDDTSTLSQWGNFTTGGVRVRRGTTNITSAGGVFRSEEHTSELQSL